MEKPGASASRQRIAAGATGVIVVRNPLAGARSGESAVTSLGEGLQRRGLQVQYVSDAGSLHDLAIRWLGEGQLRAVVAAGGDGTAAFVANHAPPESPIAVFPLGTENLLAKYLGLSAADESVANAIAGGHIRQFDAGLVHRADGTQRLFLLMLGCGFDADVIQRLHDQRRGHITHRSYIRPIWEAIRSYGYPELRVTCRDEAEAAASRTLSGHWAFVFNAPSYAIGLAICPDADPCDGRLDVTLFRGGSLWQGIWHFLAVILQRHRVSRQFQCDRARYVRIESEKPAQFQIDGDPGGMLPIEIEALPKRLTLIVPAHWPKVTTQ